ncbi:MAG: bifunctional folylpolyglutamate synthase/dihydrofolate synthase [Turicibacter sp.]|nr:bifunctional folylpolyglutamate synthase/dihydrofolate synthase [Turicibacter sp.]
MDYKEARAYIDEAAKAGISLGLDSIRNLLNELGNPQDDLKFVHIAGTNGKGSVLAYVSTILEVAGYKTGRYVSPTVQSYRERIQINRTNISPSEFATQLPKIKQAVDRLLDAGLPHPSVFEIETALGFLHFKEQSCDIVVMETGMGGVTDATNIVKNTLVSLITSVSRDHMAFLGDTIADLTRAKAGIIKKGCYVVYGSLPTESKAIVQAAARRVKSPVYLVNSADIVIQKPASKYTQTFGYKERDDITISLLGKHQIENATLAIEAVRALQNQGFAVTDDQIKTGLRDTSWFGRVTVVKEKNPVVIVDGAHNPDAARALAKTLADLFPTEKSVGVMGVFKDKEVPEILAEVKPVMRKIHAISLPDEKRTLAAEMLKEFVFASGIEAESHTDLKQALDVAKEEAEVVVVFGSLSHLGMVLDHV